MSKLITILALALSTTAFADTNSILEENLYFKAQESILSQNKSLNTVVGFSTFEQDIFMDALEDLAIEKSPEALNIIGTIDPVNFGPLEGLRLAILKIKYQRENKLPDSLKNELSTLLIGANTDIKIIYTIAAYEELLASAGAHDIIALAKQHPQYKDISDDAEKKVVYENEMFTDLVYKTPDVTSYMNGEYVKSVKIFMFCRENRLYQCLMIMKDIHGELVRNTDGSLWTHKSLASSKYGLPSYSSNGSTPTGVMTIDSVMPAADMATSFGKFRRMVLDFIPKSKDETLLRSLLPESSRDQEWWKESQVARDIGRNYLRIHGTGKINPDNTTPYYPFNRTSGCIAQRENTYDGVTFQDQRDLLDKIMASMDLPTIYANELKIKGIIYITEIDDGQEAVNLEALNAKGIQ